MRRLRYLSFWLYGAVVGCGGAESTPRLEATYSQPQALAGATTYYVSKGGGNDACSMAKEDAPGSPFLTIQGSFLAERFLYLLTTPSGSTAELNPD